MSVQATAKSAKITLVLDPANITEVDTTGTKTVDVKITVSESMVFKATLNSKSYRKAMTSIKEFGFDGCNAILQGSMPKFGQLEGAGLVVQPRAKKEEVSEPVAEQTVSEPVVESTVNESSSTLKLKRTT